MRTTILNADTYEDHDMFSHLKLDYINSVIARCDKFSHAILSTSNGNFSRIIADLGRDVHSMKGTGAMYDVAMIGPICHRFEDDLFGKQTQSTHCNEKYVFRILKFLELIKISAILEKQSLIAECFED